MDENEVKSTVEKILEHEIESERLSSMDNFGEACYETEEADKIEKGLEAAGYTLVEDEHPDYIHVHRMNWNKTPGEKLYTFCIAGWEWMLVETKEG